MAGQQILPNLPDILGKVTGGKRVNISVVQVAAAIRPRVVRAGRPFKLVILIQNAADVDLDVSATLKLPDRDAKKKRDKFISKTDQLVVAVGAAEVGYATLPITTLPDTAVGSDYKVSVDIKVSPRNRQKPSRIRSPKGGGSVNMSDLDPDIVEDIKSLTSLALVTEASGLRGTTLEIPFSIMPGKVGAVADFKPEWTSLWTMKDLVDDGMLLQKFAPLLKEKVLPALSIKKLYPSLLEKTEQQFSQAGYTLSATEARLVTKMLGLILRFASPPETLSMIAGMYNVSKTIEEYQGGEVKLPEWCSAMLHLLNRNENAAEYADKAITQLLYLDLLRDAMRHGFDRIEIALNEELGSDEDRDAYVETVMASFDEGGIPLDFERAYMPMVIAGISACDLVTYGNENMDDLMHDMIAMMDDRRDEAQGDAEATYKMARRLLDKELLKYGYDVERLK